MDDTPTGDVLSEQLFKALGEPNRLALLRCLASCRRSCSVTELSALCSMGISAASRHLAVLRKAGIIECERSGKEVLYKLRSRELSALMQSLSDFFTASTPHD